MAYSRRGKAKRVLDGQAVSVKTLITSSKVTL
jgi:hypothetical protein